MPSNLSPVTVSIRDAALSDMAGLREIFRRASLSNPGDRAALVANPEALELSDLAVREGRTRVAVIEDRSILGFATTTQPDTTVELEDLLLIPSGGSVGSLGRWYPMQSPTHGVEGLTESK